jgi:hypothetical protein
MLHINAPPNMKVPAVHGGVTEGRRRKTKTATATTRHGRRGGVRLDRIITYRCRLAYMAVLLVVVGMIKNAFLSTSNVSNVSSIFSQQRNTTSTSSTRSRSSSENKKSNGVDVDVDVDVDVHDGVEEKTDK